MDKIRMWDILPLIGIAGPSLGKSSFYVQCPCCDDDPRKKHLNINLKKEVFRCPRCGVSGGIFDLYSLYTGVPRAGVKDKLVELLGTPYGKKQEENNTVKEIPESSPLIDIEARHATYNALLDKLSLAPDHLINLMDRGLTEPEIAGLGYKTSPAVGMSLIARQLRNEGYYLEGVPGFYRDSSGNWSFVHENRGILIPVRDLDGRIQGLQIRLDNTQKRKFRWISSTDRPDGCRAQSWVHVVGSVRSTMLLTEGFMKGDIINCLGKASVVAISGVNALTHLEITLEALIGLGLNEIKICFDMDFMTNPNVQQGYRNLCDLLERLKLRYGTYLWDPIYKGLDDYLWEKCYQRKRV